MRKFRIVHRVEPGCCEQHDGDKPPDEAMPVVEAPAQAIRRRLRGKQPPPPEYKVDLATPAAPSTVRRRIRGKQPPPPDEKDDLMEQ
eukprot:6487564-Amphidinium_carterae.1